MRRRGVLAESLKDFVLATGVSKSVSLIEPAFLEHFIRNTLNNVSKRVMAVLDPLKVVITNYDGEEDIELDDYPQNETSTKRNYKFTKEIYIEKSDFMVNPIPKFKRLYPDGEVRLKGAYIVKCTGYDIDENGEVTCVYCEYDKDTRSGSECTRKVKGTIHWVSPKYAKNIEVRLINNLIEEESASLVEGQERAPEDEEYRFNPNSLIKLENAWVENDVEFNFEERYQFLRNGYFCLDKDSTNEKLVFNRTIGLKG